MDVSFGHWLEKRRKALDLTREELAGRIGFSVSALRKIETNERRPSKQFAELLASALNIPAEEQGTFIKIARGELSFERMKSTAPLPDLKPFQQPPIFPPHLPIPPTPLLGREQEVLELHQMLDDPQCRLITLVGPGGIGKTRLAIETAIQENQEHGRDVVFVSLAAVSSPSLIAQAIAEVLEFRFQGPGDPKTQLVKYLREKKLLLVLDNFEHLLDGVDLLVRIIQYAADVKMLCTSREQLNVYAEWVFEIRGLPAAEAEVLFVNSARRVESHFMPKQGDKLIIPDICSLVEGIPLAIELAAAWIRTLSLSEIKQEIERNLDFLATSMRNLPERHRSMRAVFEHSWNLMTREEREALSGLSVFRGGFTRESAEQVAGVGLDVLSALVSKSLVQRSDQKRFILHELVRQFAATQPDMTDAIERVKQRHITFFTAFAETCQGHFDGPWMLSSLEQMDQDHDNLRAALDYAITLRLSLLALRLATTMYRFWEYRGYINEGRRWLNEALTLPGMDAQEYHVQRARALNAAGSLARIQGDFAQAHCLHEESLTLQRRDRHSADLANSLNGLGTVTMFEGQYAIAETYFQESLQICRKLGIQAEVVRTLNNLGVLAMYRGDYEKARLLHEENIALCREINDRHGLAVALGNLSEVLRYEGQYNRSMQVLEEGLTMMEQIVDVRRMVILWNVKARVHMAMGDVSQALATFRTSLMQNQNVGDKTEIASVLEGLADALYMYSKPSASTSDLQLAVRLLGAADQLRATVGAPRSAAEHTDFGRVTAQLRDQLSESIFRMEWKLGTEMTTSQVVEAALYHLFQISMRTDPG